jgi:hypothetical protein
LGAVYPNVARCDRFVGHLGNCPQTGFEEIDGQLGWLVFSARKIKKLRFCLMGANGGRMESRIL